MPFDGGARAKLSLVLWRESLGCAATVRGREGGMSVRDVLVGAGSSADFLSFPELFEFRLNFRENFSANHPVCNDAHTVWLPTVLYRSAAVGCR